MSPVPSLLDLDEPTLADARRMPAQVRVPPVTRPFDVRIEVPGSKSHTNRALVLAGLASDACEIYDPLLDAEDAQVMLRALEQLGARVEVASPRHLIVHGTGSRWSPRTRQTHLHLENAGTAARFLTAASALAPSGSSVVIDGSPRMRQRPLGELVALLRSIGVQIDELGAPGCPPIRVHGLDRVEGPISLRVGRTASSQFISALLLLGPFIEHGVALWFDEPPTSKAYVDMTLGVLDRAGASAFWRDKGGLSAQCNTPEGELGGFQMKIEPDASSAGYWWCAPLVAPPGAACVPGFRRDALQGDVGVVEVLARLGAKVEWSPGLHGIRCPDGFTPSGEEIDLALMPDAAMALSAVAALASGPTLLRGLRTLRVKETDRVAALHAELTRLGCAVRVDESPADIALHISPLPRPLPAGDVIVHTYNDHRMAMGMALVGLRRPGVIIDHPACTAKTYPTFWRDLRSLYAS